MISTANVSGDWCKHCQHLNVTCRADGQQFNADRVQAIFDALCTCADQQITTLMADAWEQLYRPEYHKMETAHEPF